ncbi:MAG: NADPH-dependent glutamate synthase [Promethearchaeota archaeon]
MVKQGKIFRPKMDEQNPKERIKNFREVALGFRKEQAIFEANRCLQCAKPLCIEGCPVNIDIPKFIKLIKEDNLRDAIYTIKDYNILPAICGRVCPQENQCEAKCVLGKKGEPIAIGALERFVADWERKSKLKACPECQLSNGIKVAVIGCGPSGLTCAADLARYGYDITIFEAFHTGGGVLVYGIPEFRLPKEIVADEIDTLQMLGVKIQYNAVIGKLYTIEDLRKMGFKAFFIGVGAGLPVLLNYPGIELNGILSANEFLTRNNLMKAYKFPEYDTPIDIGKKITVIGGGNVALDSARVALRLGAEKVIIIYRRSELEMPARKEEIKHAKEEGIQFLFLTDPVKFFGDDNGNVCKMMVRKMKLGKPDETGRKRPIPIEKSEYFIETDMIIIAIGTRANPIFTRSIPQLKLNKWGYIEADAEGHTNIDDIFAGGDIVTGSATVISAMGAGRKAAKGIDKYLKKTIKKNNL